jgi:RNA-directed DNA polymerase
MIKAPISLQDLRRSLYVKAKAETTWRFWGLYVHVCKMETLHEAYQMAKSNNGAPGIDGVTFDAIEDSGVESFLKQIQDELVHKAYQPLRVRKKEIPKRRGHQSPRSFHSGHSWPCGPGGTQAHPGTDL